MKTITLGTSHFTAHLNYRRTEVTPIKLLGKCYLCRVVSHNPHYTAGTLVQIPARKLFPA